MCKIFRLLFCVLLISALAVQCKTKTSSGKTNTKTTNNQVSKSLTGTKFDTVNERLNSQSELMTEDLVAMKIIDTALTTKLSETCYCDTAIQLSDSIYYSIISVNDEAGLCTYFFVASLNKKSKKVISSKFLHPDCDVDYSWDSYETHEHALVTKDKIQVTNTTVFQKKNRTSPDEEQNIDHKQTQKSFITVSQTGQINHS